MDQALTQYFPYFISNQVFNTQAIEKTQPLADNDASRPRPVLVYWYIFEGLHEMPGFSITFNVSKKQAGYFWYIFLSSAQYNEPTISWDVRRPTESKELS